MLEREKDKEKKNDERQRDKMRAMRWDKETDNKMDSKTWGPKFVMAKTLNTELRRLWGRRAWWGLRTPEIMRGQPHNDGALICKLQPNIHAPNPSQGITTSHGGFIGMTQNCFDFRFSFRSQVQTIDIDHALLHAHARTWSNAKSMVNMFTHRCEIKRCTEILLQGDNSEELPVQLKISSADISNKVDNMRQNNGGQRASLLPSLTQVRHT